MDDQHDTKKEKKKPFVRKEIIDGKEITVIGDSKVHDPDVMKAIIPDEVEWTRDMTEDEYIFARLPLSKKAKKALIQKHLKSKITIVHPTKS